MARKESLGFFTDITDSNWKLLKNRFQLTQPNYDDSNREDFKWRARFSNLFWASQFEPEFTCQHEFRLGKLGDGGKWICDPHRIPKESCLVYSIGSNGKFQFEEEVLERVSKSCEVHTFDIAKQNRGKSFAEEAEKRGVYFHHWGIGAREETGPHLKTFKDIMVALHHEQKTVDVMKIDCEKCEYKQFREWLQDWEELGMTVRQVMLEIHNSDLPGVVDLFKAFQNYGYVMFHKEANYENQGNCIEAAFLLLSKGFQKLE